MSEFIGDCDFLVEAMPEAEGGGYRYTCPRPACGNVRFWPRLVAYHVTCRDPGKVAELREAIDGDKATEKNAGTVERAKNFINAAARWVAAGMPTRTPEATNKLHENKCKPCEHFQNDACKLCGCPVSRAGNWRNKLAWATEGCPATPPRFEADVSAGTIED